MMDKIINSCLHKADPASSPTVNAIRVYTVDGLDLVFDPAKAAKRKTDQDLARAQEQD
jgi:hypothetical protein